MDIKKTIFCLVSEYSLIQWKNWKNTYLIKLSFLQSLVHGLDFFGKFLMNNLAFELHGRGKLSRFNGPLLWKYDKLLDLLPFPEVLVFLVDLLLELVEDLRLFQHLGIGRIGDILVFAPVF
jgi:hypothetical protein